MPKDNLIDLNEVKELKKINQRRIMYSKDYTSGYQAGIEEAFRLINELLDEKIKGKK